MPKFNESYSDLHPKEALERFKRRNIFKKYIALQSNGDPDPCQVPCWIWLGKFSKRKQEKYKYSKEPYFFSNNTRHYVRDYIWRTVLGKEDYYKITMTCDCEHVAADTSVRHRDLNNPTGQSPYYSTVQRCVNPDHYNVHMAGDEIEQRNLDEFKKIYNYSGLPRRYSSHTLESIKMDPAILGHLFYEETSCWTWEGQILKHIGPVLILNGNFVQPVRQYIAETYLHDIDVKNISRMWCKKNNCVNPDHYRARKKSMKAVKNVFE